MRMSFRRCLSWPKHLAILVAVWAAPALAQESGNQSEARPYPEGISCLWMPTARSQSYSLIDDEHLVLEAVGRRYYLLTLSRRCWDLDTSLDIGISRRGDQLCTGDAIITDNDRCTIRYLEQVASYKEAKAIVDARDAAEKAERQRKRDN